MAGLAMCRSTASAMSPPYPSGLSLPEGPTPDRAKVVAATLAKGRIASRSYLGTPLAESGRSVASNERGQGSQPAPRDSVQIGVVQSPPRAVSMSETPRDAAQNGVGQPPPRAESMSGGMEYQKTSHPRMDASLKPLAQTWLRYRSSWWKHHKPGAEGPDDSPDMACQENPLFQIRAGRTGPIEGLCPDPHRCAGSRYISSVGFR